MNKYIDATICDGYCCYKRCISMKSNIRYEDVFTYRNLYNAFAKCRKGVNWKSSTQKYNANLSRNTYELYRRLNNGTYKSKGFHEFDIIERGKPRHIRAVHISERCVQYVLCEYCLLPVLEPRLIYDNGASLKGKGITFSINRLVTHLQRHYRKYGNNGYILTYDFKSYFDTIRHDKVEELLRKYIEDERLIQLTMYFVKCFGDRGLGLGSQVSQILAISYVNDVDHMIKEQLKIKGYARYMDDGYLIHEDKEYLKSCLEIIDAELKELGVILNRKKTQIAKISHGFTFLKTKFNLTSTGRIIKRPCRSSVTRMRRKLKKFKKMNIPYNDVATSFISWKGTQKNRNAYKTVKNMEKLFNELYIENWKGEINNDV